MRKENILAERLAALGYDDLPSYMASSLWQDTVATFIADSCFCCGKKTELRLYHRTFIRLGEEQPKDLVTVCSWCKRKILAMVASGACSLAEAHRRIRKRQGYTGRQQRFGDPKLHSPDLSQRDATLAELGFHQWHHYLHSAVFCANRDRVVDYYGRRCRFCAKTPTAIYFLNYNLATLSGDNLAAWIPLCQHHLYNLQGHDGKRPIAAQRRTFGFLMRDLNRRVRTVGPKAARSSRK